MPKACLLGLDPKSPIRLEHRAVEHGVVVERERKEPEIRAAAGLGMRAVDAAGAGLGDRRRGEGRTAGVTAVPAKMFSSIASTSFVLALMSMMSMRPCFVRARMLSR
jgi:hypothetical protein